MRGNGTIASFERRPFREMKLHSQITRAIGSLSGVAVALSATAPAGLAQSTTPSERPPAEFVRTWQDAVSSFSGSQKDAAAALARSKSWEPYFRSAFNTTSDQKLRNLLRPALVKNQTDLVAWNLKRGNGWAKDLRLDYLASLAAATDDSVAAAEIAQFILKAQEDIYETYRSIGPWPRATPPPKARKFIGQSVFAKLSKTADYGLLSGDRVSVVKDYKPAVICARSGDVSVRVSTFWICLCQDQLTEHDPVNWLYSVLCINNSATFHQLSNVLLVCDGDIDLTGVGGSPGTCSMSVVIANGDVSLSEGYEVRSSSVIYAAGDVYGYKRAWASTSSILAAGKNNTLPEADDPMAKQYKAYIEKYHKQGVKENPFGVKFVSPADAGVELDVGDKVVRLGKLADTSPLAKAGLQKGDRLLTQNGVRMETAADFRRQLRESLLWGTGLFEIRRGNEEFFRLVKFAEPPRK